VGGGLIRAADGFESDEGGSESGGVHSWWSPDWLVVIPASRARRRESNTW